MVFPFTSFSNTAKVPEKKIPMLRLEMAPRDIWLPKLIILSTFAGMKWMFMKNVETKLNNSKLSTSEC